MTWIFRFKGSYEYLGTMHKNKPIEGPISLKFQNTEEELLQISRKKTKQSKTK